MPEIISVGMIAGLVIGLIGYLLKATVFEKINEHERVLKKMDNDVEVLKAILMRVERNLDRALEEDDSCKK